MYIVKDESEAVLQWNYTPDFFFLLSTVIIRLDPFLKEIGD